MTLGRWLIVIGAIFAVAGLLVMLGAKLGLPRLGHLPGDIVYRGKNTTIYVPIVTCIVVSILLTIVFSLFNRFR
jgi:multisubunit Na+/H+ antiporter MnhG subunit